MSVWTNILKKVRFAKNLRHANDFQNMLFTSCSGHPKSIDELFPDNRKEPIRLILLTSKRALKGRSFFIECLNAKVLYSIPEELRSDDVFGCFGYEDFLKNAALLKQRNITRIFFLEAGFLRGILMDSSGSIYDRAWCFFADDLGFHYDPNHASRLELIINSGAMEFSKEQLERARRLRNTLISNRITKYNDQQLEFALPKRDRTRVLVVEQARKDWAILKSGGNRHSFEEMVKTAIDQNPDAEILLKVHPDTLNGKRGGIEKSYYGRIKNEGQIRVIKDKINPIALLESVEKVYVFSSMMGFEAAMMGKEVHLFGKPIYGGWGITIDYQQYPRRTRQRTLDELVYIIYIMYQKYKNADGLWCEAEETISDLIRLRAEYFSLTEGS